MTKIRNSKPDGLVKSWEFTLIVIPVKTGIQYFQLILDSCVRRSDALLDSLRIHQTCLVFEY